jgi:hypothetical protein
LVARAYVALTTFVITINAAADLVIVLRLPCPRRTPDGLPSSILFNTCVLKAALLTRSYPGAEVVTGKALHTVSGAILLANPIAGVIWFGQGSNTIGAFADIFITALLQEAIVSTLLSVVVVRSMVTQRALVRGIPRGASPVLTDKRADSVDAATVVWASIQSLFALIDVLAACRGVADG